MEVVLVLEGRRRLPPLQAKGNPALTHKGTAEVRVLAANRPDELANYEGDRRRRNSFGPAAWPPPSKDIRLSVRAGAYVRLPQAARQLGSSLAACGFQPQPPGRPALAQDLRPGSRRTSPT